MLLTREQFRKEVFLRDMEKIMSKRNEMIPTLKELILCLPVEYRKKVLKFVEDTHFEVSSCDIGAVISQYNAIENEIKKYLIDEKIYKNE